MKVSKQLFPFFGANIITEFYLPSFSHYFKEGEIIEPEHKQKFEEALRKFQNFLNQN